jgi:hypothetical protein
MSDGWLAAIYIAVFVVLGLVIAVVVISRTRIVVARAAEAQVQHYREVAERAAAAQREVAEELARLTDRVAAVEALMRSVG